MTWVVLPIILFVTFVSYVEVDGMLTPRKVFTTFSLLTYGRVSLHLFVSATLQGFEGYVGMERISVSVKANKSMKLLCRKEGRA